MAAVCVYCASGEGIDERYKQLAAAVGTRLAADGHSLISGGGRVSMMGAVARAAREGGAHTTGVIPSHLMSYEVADTEADELVVVDTMRERGFVRAAALERLHRVRTVDEAFTLLPGLLAS